MKKPLLSVLSVLCCVSLAWAHPTDSDRLSKVGVNSTLKVSKDLNIVPGKKTYSLMGDITPSVDDRGNDYECNLNLKETAEFDRAIPKGAAWTIQKMETSSDIMPDTDGRVEDVRTIIHVANAPYLDSIVCTVTTGLNNYSRRFGPGYTPELTIGLFRQYTAGVLELELAPPVILSSAAGTSPHDMKSATLQSVKNSAPNWDTAPATP